MKPESIEPPRRSILLTGEVEFPYLSQWLREANPNILVERAAHWSHLEALLAQDCRSTSLIAFVTDIIVPKCALEAVRGQAVNIHPGPSAYPGSDAASWALYEQAARFGVTAHFMTERVDSGPIIDCASFALQAEWSLAQLNEHTYRAAISLFLQLAPSLAGKAAPLIANGEVWSGRKRNRKDRLGLVQKLADLPLEAQKRAKRAFELDLETRD